MVSTEPLVLSKDAITYSNSQDFIMAVKYISLKHCVEVEFFLDGVSCGNSIELIFHECNKALDLINEKGLTEY